MTCYVIFDPRSGLYYGGPRPGGDLWVTDAGQIERWRSMIDARAIADVLAEAIGGGLRVKRATFDGVRVRVGV